MKKIVAAFAGILLLFSASITTAFAQTHEVQEGDNLWELANEYNTTVDEIMEINELETSTIQPKQLLYISKIYEVKRGDTLQFIGDEHNVSVEDLKEWNDLETSLIIVGESLRINDTEVNEEEAAVEQKAKTETKTEAKSQPEPKEESTKAPAEPVAVEKEPQGKTLAVTATAYTAECAGCSGVTYTGVDLNKDRNAKVIAVDPNVIPLGSKVYVEGYGHAIAADIGSAIKGKKIDLHVPTKSEAFAWGVRTVNITVIE